MSDFPDPAAMQYALETIAADHKRKIASHRRAQRDQLVATLSIVLGIVLLIALVAVAVALIGGGAGAVMP